MNLTRLLQQRVADGNPVRIGLIGAGKFGSMYLSQIPRTPGIHLLGVADLDPVRAQESLRRVGWKDEQFAAKSFSEAFKGGATFVSDDAMSLIRNRHIEVIIDATGSPAAGIAHVLACCDHRKHIVMVNVEADALAGPLLAKRAAQAGIVYSLAYGDQPALICEMVDWARAAGFEVVAAGKGTKCPPITPPRPIPSGATTVSVKRRSAAATSTRRCSTPSSTAPRARSRWRPWPTRPA